MVLQKISLLFPFSKPLPFENFVKYIYDLKRFRPFGMSKKIYNPANTYLFEVNNKNTRKRYKICSKLTMQTPA